MAEHGVGLPSDPKVRKQYPVATGVLDYFPDAICEVARCSFAGNEQHHPGAPLHWDRSKSTDEADALMRHFLARGTTDTDGIRHSAKAAWRALALLQKELEMEQAQAPVKEPEPAGSLETEGTSGTGTVPDSLTLATQQQLHNEAYLAALRQEMGRIHQDRSWYSAFVGGPIKTHDGSGV